MNAVDPNIPEGSRLVIYAKDQLEYDPLPASVDASGVVTTEWEPSEEELHRLLCGGRLRLRVLTFGSPLQPVALDVLAPECGIAKES
jgi:hypothetical protein